MTLRILLFSALLLAVGRGAEITDILPLLEKNDTAALFAKVQTKEEANLFRSDNKKTLLMYAAWTGNEAAVSHLLYKGADVNAKDKDGVTALHLAVWKGHNAIALRLLEHGADPAVQANDGMTPLIMSKLKENKKMEEALTRRIGD